MYNYCNAIIILPYRTIPPYHCVLLTWQLYCYVTQQGRSKTSIIRCKWIYLLYFQVWYSVLTCTNTGITVHLFLFACLQYVPVCINQIPKNVKQIKYLTKSLTQDGCISQQYEWNFFQRGDRKRLSRTVVHVYIKYCVL